MAVDYLPIYLSIYLSPDLHIARDVNAKGC